MQSSLFNVENEDLPFVLRGGDGGSQQKILVFDCSKLPRPESKIMTFADNSDPSTWPDIKSAASKLSNEFKSGTIIYNKYTEYIGYEQRDKLGELGDYEGEIVEGKLMKLRRDEQGFVSYYELLWTIIQYLKEVYTPAESTIKDGNGNEIARLHIDEKYGIVMPNVIINILFSGAPSDVGRQTIEILQEFYEVCKNRPITINCISFSTNIENGIFYSNLWRNSTKQGLFVFGYDRAILPQLLPSAKIMTFVIAFIKRAAEQPCILYTQEVKNGDRSSTLFIRATDIPILNKQFLLIKAAEIEDLKKNSFGGERVACRVVCNWSNINEVEVEIKNEEGANELLGWQKCGPADVQYCINNLLLLSIFFRISAKLDKLTAAALIKKIAEIVPPAEDKDDDIVINNDTGVELLNDNNNDSKLKDIKVSEENRIFADVITNILQKIISRRTSTTDAIFNNEINTYFCNLAHSFSLTLL